VARCGIAARRVRDAEQLQGGDLRGCIGHVMNDRPLGEVIRQVAVSAARSDPRFPPVQLDELSALRIEISRARTVGHRRRRPL